MTASKGQVVSIRYTLRVDGELVDQGELDYLHGYRNIISGLEEALEGKSVGDRVVVSVPPDKGYGPYDPDGVQVVERSAFPPGAEVEEGAVFYAEDADGNPVPFTVLGVEGDSVTIDFNHVLAGETLEFDVTLTGVRPATQEELEHGHAHSPHGHTH
ncbi:MAG: peptidylprolyl isomerase [Meiothermus sp.]|uniref:FKBP-type peptidyl-prolyl cis-trans isomerase n=1 Tax=Meiothermus sp. TaxID=1955249 RepID=UPI002616B2EB|nr:peptidylprolyl isomerase [Meiothermus sp.]MCS7059137.1 peptidylprolyl isomerase [Meiothermus sp.]MCX7741198.1 peptidylprolyl isomerase [Meiothermus sp.]MDW8481079.1 peptidylprolyl isomerase [Meiothermus sp.]